jgi:hypothetical protein
MEVRGLITMTRYYLKAAWQLYETEVTKEEFIAAERNAGYYPKRSGEPSTGGFSSRGISGSVSYKENVENWPVLEIDIQALEEPMITGVWGEVDIDTLKEIQDSLYVEDFVPDVSLYIEDFVPNFSTAAPHLRVTIQITGYTYPVYDGSTIIKNGRYSWRILKEVDLSLTAEKLEDVSKNSEENIEIKPSD